MKLHRIYHLVSALAIGAAALMTTSMSRAATWEFSQGGYDGGAHTEPGWEQSALLILLR